VGARRPTVSIVLAELARDGQLMRRDDGSWLLTGEPVSGACGAVDVIHQRWRLMPERGHADIPGADPLPTALSCGGVPPCCGPSAPGGWRRCAPPRSSAAPSAGPSRTGRAARPSGASEKGRGTLHGMLASADASPPDDEDAGDAELERREHALAERERLAEMREWRANRRDRIADERDRVANERERRADERERRADEREGTAEARERERLERLDEAERRSRAAEERDQAQIDRESAASERAAASENRSPGPPAQERKDR
jgi:hypothetical protein